MRKKLQLFLIGFFLVLSQFATVGAATTRNYVDVPNNLYGRALITAVNNGLIPEGSTRLHPNRNLTRSEFASMLVYAVKATDVGTKSYLDVTNVTPYSEALRKAANLGFLTSTSGMLRPTVDVTREEIAIGLAVLLQLNGNEDRLVDVVDKDLIDAAATKPVAAMLARGYFALQKGKVNPKGAMSRGEFAYVLTKAIGQFINTPGLVTQANKGNMIVNVANVTLKNITVSGDLILADGIGDGNVTLDNVKVLGRLVVRGGGQNSIHLTNGTTVQTMVVDAIRSNPRIVIDDASVVLLAEVLSSMILDGKVKQLNIMAKESSSSFGSVPNVQIRSQIERLIARIESLIAVSDAGDVQNLDLTGSAIGVNNAGKITKVTIDGNNIILGGEGILDIVINGENNQINAPNARVQVGSGRNNRVGNNTIDPNTSYTVNGQGSDIIRPEVPRPLPTPRPTTPEITKLPYSDVWMLNDTSMTFVVREVDSIWYGEVQVAINPDLGDDSEVIFPYAVYEDGSYTIYFESALDYNHHLIVLKKSGYLDTTIDLDDIFFGEPNETMDTAYEVEIDAPPQRHWIYPSIDEDWFVFEVTQEGQRLTIETLNSLPYNDNSWQYSMDTVISLYDGSGELLDENDDGSWDGYEASLTYEFEEIGLYYFRVLHYREWTSSSVDEDEIVVGRSIDEEDEIVVGRYDIQVTTAQDTLPATWEIGDIIIKDISPLYSGDATTMDMPTEMMVIGFEYILYGLDSTDEIDIEGASITANGELYFVDYPFARLFIPITYYNVPVDPYPVDVIIGDLHYSGLFEEFVIKVAYAEFSEDDQAYYLLDADENSIDLVDHLFIAYQIDDQWYQLNQASSLDYLDLPHQNIQSVFVATSDGKYYLMYWGID